VLRTAQYVVVTALVCGLTTPAAAGYFMEHEAVIPNPATLQPIQTKIRSWHEGRRFKRESPLRKETVIIDLDKREVFGVNDEARTYWKLSADKYKALAMMSLVVMGVQLQPDGSVRVPDTLFVKSGKSAKIAGRSSYEVAVQLPKGSPMTTSVWLSKEVDVPIAKMVDELRLALGDPRDPAFQSLFNQWLALEGYPVQTVTTVKTPQGTIVTSETLLSVKQQSIPASAFQVPKGYALTEDPITQAERMMRQQMQSRPPVGLGAPIGGKR
jgi:hypothetical protein